MNFSIDAINISGKTALTGELKPFRVTFSSTDDPWFSGLKYHILKYFEDWLTTIEERPAVHEKSEKQKLFT